jgi:hypothetical protein
MATKRKPKFKVGQVVAATISEVTWRIGEVGKVQQGDLAVSVENGGLLELRGAEGARHWFWPSEVRSLTKRERGE